MRASLLLPLSWYFSPDTSIERREEKQHHIICIYHASHHRHYDEQLVPVEKHTDSQYAGGPISITYQNLVKEKLCRANSGERIIRNPPASMHACKRKENRNLSLKTDAPTRFATIPQTIHASTHCSSSLQSIFPIECQSGSNLCGELYLRSQAGDPPTVFSVDVREYGVFARWNLPGQVDSLR